MQSTKLLTLLLIATMVTSVLSAQENSKEFIVKAQPTYIGNTAKGSELGIIIEKIHLRACDSSEGKSLNVYGSEKSKSKIKKPSIHKIGDSITFTYGHSADPDYPDYKYDTTVTMILDFEHINWIAPIFNLSYQNDDFTSKLIGYYVYFSHDKKSSQRIHKLYYIKYQDLQNILSKKELKILKESVFIEK